MMNSWYSIILAVYFFVLTSALHLEVPCSSNPKPVCIRDFIQQEEMVVVSISTSGRVGDGQELSFKVTDTMNNEYRSAKDIAGKVKFTFSTHNSAAVDICFTNRKKEKWTHSRNDLLRDIELEIESGAAARDWNSVQAAEKLKPNELELKRVEALTQEIAHELQYLKAREERMRDTNESTNSRVKWFSVIIIISLVSLGVWQILYLRNYFRIKHII